VKTLIDLISVHINYDYKIISSGGKQLFVTTKAILVSMDRKKVKLYLNDL
jgi:hypothetical protein